MTGASSRTVLNVNVPSDAIAGSRITAIASSGDEVSFTVPKGVVPGAKLQVTLLFSCVQAWSII